MPRSEHEPRVDAVMIELARVSRAFGDVQALADVSFTVRAGEIVGLLGDNGAGKTTALRLCAGFLAADAGTVRIAGVNVAADPLAARRQLGVLVEGAPAYGEMRVRDYLGFRARLKCVRRGPGGIDEVIARCELGDVARRPVAQLSRGYRQRLGLADALLGAPPVLILDEPASGLDPLQIVKLRQLISGLAPAHTVLLSSHALGEIEQVATRVVILARGRVVAEDTPAALAARLPTRGTLVQVAAGEVDKAVATLGEGAVVADAAAGRVETPLAPDEVTRRLVGAGVTVHEVRAQRASLEEVFVALSGTGK